MGIRTAATAVASALALTLLAGGSASALIVSIQGPNYSEMLYNTGAANGPSFDTKSKPGGYFVQFASTSDQLAQAGAGNGHAWIAGTSGYVNDLEITPDDPLLAGFSAFAITVGMPPSIDVPIIKKNGDPDVKKVNFKSEDFKVDFNFVGGGLLTITIPGIYLPDWPSSGQINFEISGADTAITGIKFYDLNAYDDDGVKYADVGFQDFKQPSFEAVLATTSVPEPATWGLMIVGLGGMGAMLRRRRAKTAFA